MIKTVYKKFLKFIKTYGNKRKQTWYDKPHMFNDKMKKGFYVRAYGTGGIEKLNTKYAGHILDLYCIRLWSAAPFCKNFARLYFDTKHLDKGLNRGDEIFGALFSKKCLFF